MHMFLLEYNLQLNSDMNFSTEDLMIHFSLK